MWRLYRNPKLFIISNMSFHFTQYEQNHSFHREIMKSYYKVVFHQGEMIFYLASKRFTMSLEKTILIA